MAMIEPLSPLLPLFTAEQTRELDRIAIEQQDIPGYELMCRAGTAAFELMQARWPQARRVLVLCGVGNNGGDGYVLARLVHAAELDVQVLQLGEVSRVRGDALRALEDLRAVGLEPVAFAGELPAATDVVVDALLGTGLERDVEGTWAEAIAAMNALGRPVLAVDIPSGLHAARGVVLGTAVHADATITFIGRKQGLYTGVAPDHVGDVVFADLGVPPAVFDRVPPAAQLLAAPPLGPLTQPRARHANKGSHGHVLIVGGDAGMPGAVIMAGEAALRSGAGLVSVATHPDHAAGIPLARPELICHGLDHKDALASLVKRATVAAIGPGLGQNRWGAEWFGALLDSALHLVVDADALNLLAREPCQRGNWILTPHPGEAARLLGTGVETINADRFAAVRALAERFQATVVLKGAGSLITDAGGAVSVCDRGNPGMAAGGMGDVLTGVIAALWAQGLTSRAAAEAGVWVHGAAGDRVAVDGERGMLASDVITALRAEVNGL